eukprot:COSAG02_NODE_185_length_30442_cov_59.370168_1_plen_381_part_10
MTSVAARPLLGRADTSMTQWAQQYGRSSSAPSVSEANFCHTSDGPAEVALTLCNRKKPLYLTAAAKINICAMIPGTVAVGLSLAAPLRLDCLWRQSPQFADCCVPLDGYVIQTTIQQMACLVPALLGTLPFVAGGSNTAFSRQLKPLARPAEGPPWEPLHEEVMTLSLCWDRLLLAVSYFSLVPNDAGFGFSIAHLVDEALASDWTARLWPFTFACMLASNLFFICARHREITELKHHASMRNQGSLQMVTPRKGGCACTWQQQLATVFCLYMALLAGAYGWFRMLKHLETCPTGHESVPPRTESIKGAGTPVYTFMNGIDMPGNDYSTLQHPSSFGAAGCKAACAGDARCRAWTWMERSDAHVPTAGSGDCRLKSQVGCP